MVKFLPLFISFHLARSKHIPEGGVEVLSPAWPEVGAAGEVADCREDPVSLDVGVGEVASGREDLASIDCILNTRRAVSTSFLVSGISCESILDINLFTTLP